jgi:hypothetical protein
MSKVNVKKKQLNGLEINQILQFNSVNIIKILKI